MNKNKILKAMPTVLFAVGIVGIFVSEALTVRATAKAKDILTKEKTVVKPGEDPEDVTTYYHINDKGFKESQQIIVVDNKKEYVQEVVKATWKCFIPTLFSTTVTITSLVMSKRMTAKQIAALSTAAMSGMGLVQKYRKEILERTDPEILRQIDSAVAEATMSEANPPCITTNHLISGEEFDTADDGEYLFFDPLTKMKFRTTKLAANAARYYLNRNFCLGGCVGLEMFYGFLGLTLPEEFRSFEWDMDKMCDDGYAWIDIDFVRSDLEDPETNELYYIIEYAFDPGELEDGPYTYPFGNPLISEGSVSL